MATTRKTQHVRKLAGLILGMDGFALPMDAVTESIGILAKRRVGKSTTARRIVEQLHHAKQHVVIVDPKGDWWGLRYARDGKRPGLPITVLGGEHGDLPLELSAGEVVARLVVEERVSVILDLSMIRKDDVSTFMTPFLETLYRLKAGEKYRTPMMLVIDEADEIAPQTPDRKGDRLMTGAVEDHVRRGGQRGIGVMVITQRAALLSKNVLTQSGILILLRTIAPQDLKAADAWITVHGTPAERLMVRQELPTLAKGEAFVWAPGWPSGHGIFQRVQMQLPETFDSSSTPEAGHKIRAPKRAARVNLGALQQKMAATIEVAKANDPKFLRTDLVEAKRALAQLQARYASLEAERDALAKTASSQAAKRHHAQLKRAEGKLRALVESIGDQFAALTASASREREQWGATVDRITQRVRETVKTLPASMITSPPVLRTSLQDPRKAPPSSERRPAPERPADAKDLGDLGTGERDILKAIASRADRTTGTTREELMLLTSLRRTTVNTYVLRLKTRGFIVESAGHLSETDAGVDALGGDVGPAIAPGAPLLAHHLQTLPDGEAKILRLIAGESADGAHTATRSSLVEMSGFKRTTVNTYVLKLKTRRLVLEEGGQLYIHALLRAAA